MASNPKIYSRLATMKKIEQWFCKRFPIYLLATVGIMIVMTVISWGER